MSVQDVLGLAGTLRANNDSFALATVVRTVAVTAAKAGAKAVICADGVITGGWIGGGCVRGAVLKAARAALADGQPRLISVQPREALALHGVSAGQSLGGIEFASNMCPSQGSMDIFVEPFLPRPHLAVCGASPVAVCVAELAARMGFRVTVAAPGAEHGRFEAVERMLDGSALPATTKGVDYIVVATQGSGDLAALTAALGLQARYVAFVGSRRKSDVLRASLEAAGVVPGLIASVHMPAGLDLGAITPDEIAFSIVAEIISVRRQGQR